MRLDRIETGMMEIPDGFFDDDTEDWIVTVSGAESVQLALVGGQPDAFLHCLR